jgi:hypothetical protein
MSQSPTRATGRDVVESVATVRVDDHEVRSNLTIHVEHPAHDGGTRCFFRSRESAPAAIRSHLRRLSDEIVRVEVIDEADLGLSERELIPESWRHAEDDPEVVVCA